MEVGAEMVDEVVIGEIVDECTFKANCVAIWAECMGLEIGAEELSEFDR
jgi:hypothetical protein